MHVKKQNCAKIQNSSFKREIEEDELNKARPNKSSAKLYSNQTFDAGIKNNKSDDNYILSISGKRKYDAFIKDDCTLRKDNYICSKKNNKEHIKQNTYAESNDNTIKEHSFTKKEIEANIDCEYATTLINSIKVDKSKEKELKMRALTTWFEDKFVPLMFSKSGSFACKEFLGLLDEKQFVQHLELLWEADMASLVADTNSSFVMKAFFERITALLAEKDKEICGLLKQWIKKFHEFSLNYLEQFLNDSVAIFVLDAFLRVLGGLTKVFPKKGKKHRGEAELKWSRVPKKFIKLFSFLAESIIGKVSLEEWLEDSHRIVVLITLLDILHHRLPGNCQELLQPYFQIFAPKDSRFLLMSKNGSILGEKMWILATEEQQKDIFMTHLNSHISNLARDNFANFFVQKALGSSHSEETFKSLSKELYPSFASFLSSTAGSNIILAMAKGCLKHTSSQKKFSKHLKEALQCTDKPILFLPLVMYLIPLEKYNEDDEYEISTIGSLLAQTLFSFEKNKQLMESLLKLNALKLACSQQGSFVLEACLSSPSVHEGSKKSILSSLKPHAVDLLKNQSGSRIFDVLWEQLAGKEREALLTNLVAMEHSLQANPNWKFVKLQVGLNLFKFNKVKWLRTFGEAS